MGGIPSKDEGKHRRHRHLSHRRDKGKIVQVFTRLPEVKEVLASGGTKASIIVEGGVQIDLRVVEEDSYGAALQYFTGSKEHNVHLRGIAKAQGIKLNEYGVFKGEKKIGGKEEKEVYQALGLPWMEPEIREDRGEIEAARDGRLPKLIRESEIKGDLHVHTRSSDGTSTIEEVVKAAQRHGYQYVAICDHSQSLKIAHGLDESRLAKQMEEIDRLNEKLKEFRILKGIEVDILMEGVWTSPTRYWKNSIWSSPRSQRFQAGPEKDDPEDHPGLRKSGGGCSGPSTGRLLGSRILTKWKWMK